MKLLTSEPSSAWRRPISRRGLIQRAGAAGLATLASRATAFAQSSNDPTPDYTLRIAPTSLEIAPGKVIKTTCYNGTVPGPVLRLKEGRPVNIKAINDGGYPNLIHSHGLMIPSIEDGATEEGSKIIPPGESLFIRIRPNPQARAGTTATRWR